MYSSRPASEPTVRHPRRCQYLKPSRLQTPTSKGRTGPFHHYESQAHPRHPGCQETSTWGLPILVFSITTEASRRWIGTDDEMIEMT